MQQTHLNRPVPCSLHALTYARVHLRTHTTHATHAQHACACACAYTHTHTHTHTHLGSIRHVTHRASSSCSTHARTPLARTHTHTGKHARAQARTHARTHARAQARTRARARTHNDTTRVQWAPAPPPVLARGSRESLSPVYSSLAAKAAKGGCGNQGSRESPSPLARRPGLQPPPPSRQRPSLCRPPPCRPFARRQGRRKAAPAPRQPQPPSRPAAPAARSRASGPCAVLLWPSPGPLLSPTTRVQGAPPRRSSAQASASALAPRNP